MTRESASRGSMRKTNGIEVAPSPDDDALDTEPVASSHETTPWVARQPLVTASSPAPLDGEVVPAAYKVTISRTAATTEPTIVRPAPAPIRMLRVPSRRMR